MWLYFRFPSERVKLNCVTHCVNFEFLYILGNCLWFVIKLKHHKSNRFTVQNIFLLCYSRSRLECIFKYICTTSCPKYFPNHSKYTCNIIVTCRLSHFRRYAVKGRGLCVLSIGFRIFCWYRGFCHRTGSDLLLFLFTQSSDINPLTDITWNIRNTITDRLRIVSSTDYSHTADI